MSEHENGDYTDAKEFVPPIYHSTVVPPKSTLLPEELAIVNEKEEYYAINPSKKNYAIFLNYGLDRYEEMSATLRTSLEPFNFQVIPYDNLTLENTKEMLNTVKVAFSQETTGCLVVAVRAKGDGFGLLKLNGTDTKLLPNELWELFSNRNCPNLINVPKIFIIEESAEGDCVTDSAVITPPPDMFKIPIYSDIITLTSAFDHNKNSESLLIKSFCEEMQGHKDGWHMIQIMTFVIKKTNMLAMRQLKQCQHKLTGNAQLATTLTKLLYIPRVSTTPAHS